MKILISRTHLFEGTESKALDQIDVLASTNKFIELATAALKKEYPSAEIDSGDLYHGDQVVNDDNEPDDDETQWVREITGKVYQEWNWIVLNNPASILGRKGGSVKSERKAITSRENGKKGGRPTK
jgi:hypothetical protein